MYIGDEVAFEGVGPSANNEFLEHGEKLCASCPMGTRLDGVQCSACPLGTFSANIDSAVCETCQGGEYSDVEGQAQCNKCPGGTYLGTDPEPSGHDSSNDCQSCR